MAGRLVCTRCGTPQGQGGARAGSSRSRRRAVGQAGRWPVWAWFVLGLVAVIVVLPLLLG
ncbi:MAG: hypothetical protein ACPHAS_09130 [Synechococcus sp.]